MKPKPKSITRVETKTTVQYELSEEDFRILFSDGRLRGLPDIKNHNRSIKFTWTTSEITMEPKE